MRIDDIAGELAFVLSWLFVWGSVGIWLLADFVKCTYKKIYCYLKPFKYGYCQYAEGEPKHKAIITTSNGKVRFYHASGELYTVCSSWSRYFTEYRHGK